jgi:peptidyl-prolyl cis-trans isomerase B (cyclophilin B)
VPSNEQRRQAAKQKLENQMTRQAEKAQRRKVITIVTTVAVVVALVVGGFLFASTSGGENSEAAPPPATGPQGSGGPCAYQKSETASKPVALPQDSNPTPAQGTQRISLKTSQGEIPVVLDNAKAPCTTQSFAHLARAKFFDNTDCHRMTTGEGLKVLQCGDPTAQGSGGPGYQFKDEPPTDLRPAPAPYDSNGAKVYPRGTLAMANSGPNSNGSQFFMVYQDSYLPPNYTVFGTIDTAGLSTLDKVAAAGVTPTNGEGDGKPNLPVHIDQAAAPAV